MSSVPLLTFLLESELELEGDFSSRGGRGDLALCTLHACVCVLSLRPTGCIQVKWYFYKTYLSVIHVPWMQIRYMFEDVLRTGALPGV